MVRQIASHSVPARVKTQRSFPVERKCCPSRSYNIVKDSVHIRDFHATVLHLLGYDHQRFSIRHQGLDQRLTGVEPAQVIRELIA